MVDWCILRTASSKTLALAASLNEAGFEAWTPEGPQEVRIGPYRTRREVRTALIPSFVFVRVDRLPDLLELAHSPSLLYQVWDVELRRMVTKGHPFFRVFRNGDHRFVSDAALSALRRAEKRPRPMQVKRLFRMGEEVRIDDDSFAGLVGTVVAVHGKMVTVAFGSWEPKIAAYLIRPAIDDMPQVHVCTPGTEQAQSVRNAA